MTIFKPQLNDDIVAAFSKIKPILEDENVGQEIQKDYQFIETQDQFLKAVSDYDDVDTIVVDIETTSLSARTGVVIGIDFKFFGI